VDSAVDIIDSDSQAIGFSLRTGYYLCQCSNAAYEEPGNWIEQLALGDTVRPFECESFHGFVAAQRRMAIVAFRGTVSVGNFLTDAEAALVHHGLFPGLVHYGFCQAVETVYPAVRTLLRAFPREMPIWVTGHSLGGAMASLVAHRLGEDGFPVRAVYTYGSPRAGDKKFCDAYRLPNYRFVNDNDLVPHLPLRWCYRHVGELKLLTNDGQLLEEESDWKRQQRALVKDAKQVQKAHRNEADPPLKIGEFDWLADHHLEGYLNGISLLLPRVPRRKHPDFAGTEMGGVPLHYLDEPPEPIVQQPIIPRPKVAAPQLPPVPVPTLDENDLTDTFVARPKAA
jgi:hypothetical protein